MARYRAVLFDWMLTLAHYPTDADFIRAAYRRIGRPTDALMVDAAVDSMRQAREVPRVRERMRFEDISFDMHRSVNMEVFELAGFDEELAETVYSLIGHPDLHPLYPDAGEVVRSIHAGGIRIAVISDIHVDLRQHAERFGIASAIEGWVLSFERGMQKPDLRMFTTAIETLGVEPTEALMVGDRVSRDGAAAQLGIDTLILPATGSYGRRGLDQVVRLLD